MSTYGTNEQIVIVAANDFRVENAQYKAVDAGGEFCSAEDALAIGIAMSKANSGDHLSVAPVGKLLYHAGAAIASAGVYLTTAASGFIVTAASGDPVVGRALQIGNSGDLLNGWFNFAAGHRT